MKYSKNISGVKYSPNSPFLSVEYIPELDTSVEWNENQVSLYQNLIGVSSSSDILKLHLRSQLYPKNLDFPITGHLVHVLHIFKYLEIHNENVLAFDTCNWRVTSDQDNQSKVQAMKNLYVDDGEEISPNVLKPIGKSVQVNYLANYNHARDGTTRRSKLEIILHCNSAPII